MNFFMLPLIYYDLMHFTVHYYNIASRAAQSNSVYVRVLKKLELPSAIASGNSYASFVLSKLPACSIT